MQKIHKSTFLKKSKIKISFYFTLIAVLVLMIFVFGFFNLKYQKNLSLEKKSLDKAVREVMVNSVAKKETFKKNKKKRYFKSINFFIINEKKRTIIKEENNYNFDSSDFLLKMGSFANKYDIKTIEQDGNYFLISKTRIKSKGRSKIKRNDVSLIVFKKMFYSKNDLYHDFLISLIFISIFGLFLYFLTFTLVSRNLKKVEKNFEEMENFIHNAGHELKTPLSVISSNLQLAAKIGTIKDFKELNSENLIEVNKANALIEGLFTLSQITKENDLKLINLKFFIEKIILENGKKISEKNISIKQKLEDFDFKISDNHFYILFSNILFNAIRYSEQNGEITISLKNNVLEISDKGIGISKENLEKIFDRFFQEGESRETANGFGIGLSLVKKISEVYGLKISVESVKNVGTKFIIKF